MKVTEKMAEAMREEKAEGATMAAIARRHGVHESTVKRYTEGTAGRGPGSSNPGQRRATAEESAEMWRLYCSGLTQQQIGERYSMTQGAVSQRLKAYAADLDTPTREVVFARELDLLAELRQRQMAMVTNQQLPPKLRLEAADRVLKGAERLAKMFGLDAAAELQVTAPVRFEIVGVPDEALS